MAPYRLPGWEIVNDDGILIATRTIPLSEYQRCNGAVDEVTARDEGELWVLLDAHTRLAERLATAEALRPKVKAHPSARPVQAVEPLTG